MSEQLNEEFNNFLHKVNQVSSIVSKLASADKQLQEIGDSEAREYLGELNEGKYANLSENSAVLTVKSDRTVINKKALLRDEDPGTQTREAFMEEMSKDADRRYKDKLRRKERMETFKKQATLAFRRKEYEKALSLYDKAIEQIRDSCVLYSNRALTYINLKFYDKAIEDCGWALRLNENSLKARLLLAKAHFLKGEIEDFERNINEAKERSNEDVDFINDFVQKLTVDANGKE